MAGQGHTKTRHEGKVKKVHGLLSLTFGGVLFPGELDLHAKVFCSLPKRISDELYIRGCWMTILTPMGGV